MSENSNTSNVQLPGIINSILGQWADDIIERVNESVRFLGITTTQITDGSTVSTIVINGQSVSVSTGDIAVYSGDYFLFYSSAWHAGGGGPSSIAAEDVSYDNTTSGLTATDVQDAVDEVVNDLSDKLDKANPTGTGSLSLNRKANTTIGINSVAVGDQTTASGNYSYAEGGGTTASGAQSHAEGASTTASGSCAHAEGVSTTASGDVSHAEGTGTIAAGFSQHVGGKYNVADNNLYAEIIGNGTANNARSNARTLDWQGNETIAGDLTFNGSTSLSDTLDDKTTYKECTQAQYDAWEQAGAVESDVSYYITNGNNPNVVTASQVMYDNTDSGLSADKVQGAIDEVASILGAIGTVSSASWTASASTAGNTQLTNYLSLTKGTYLVIVAYPVLGNDDLFVSGIDGANISQWGASFINMQSQQSAVKIVRANADTQIRILSMQSFSQSFSYLDRGGLFAIRIV